MTCAFYMLSGLSVVLLMEISCCASDYLRRLLFISHEVKSHLHKHWQTSMKWYFTCLPHRYMHTLRTRGSHSQWRLILKMQMTTMRSAYKAECK